MSTQETILKRYRDQQVAFGRSLERMPITDLVRGYDHIISSRAVKFDRLEGTIEIWLNKVIVERLNKSK